VTFPTGFGTNRASPDRLGFVMGLQGPVLVTGAKGTTGRRVVERLRTEEVETRAASRSSDTPFDWLRPETWGPAIQGMRSIYIVPEGCPDADVMASFCQAAVDEEVAALVLLSTRDAEFESEEFEWYLDIEDAVVDAGTGWTILRPSWFCQNFYTTHDQEVRSGLLELPAGDGGEAFVDADDIAEVAFQALTMHGHEDKTYNLSGPEPLSFREATEKISVLTGLTVQYRPISEEEYFQRLVAKGMPEGQAKMRASAYRPIAKGESDYISEGVRRLLGHSAKDFDTFVRESVEKGIWPRA
jgi:uncharacterized protein YbjT (DUF2867 family)